MLGRILFISGVVSFVLLCLLVQTTTPGTIGPLGILAVFICLYGSVLSVLTFVLYGVSKFLKKTLTLLGVKRPFNTLSLARAYYFSSVSALAPVMLLAIQSVGELGVYDVVLVGVFVLISCVYIAKRTA